MSIRTMNVDASAEIELAGEIYPVVTLEDLQRAMLVAANVLHLAGGTIGVILKRIPTGTPNEMVATQALISWQDRTNAKPQAEPDARAEAVENPPETVDRPVHETVDGGEPEAPDPHDEFLSTPPVDDVGDGLVIDPLAEDVSSIPKHLRAAV